MGTELRRARLPDVAAWMAAAFLVCAVFITNYALALRFDRAAVFSQYNVLFDADASSRVACFANGWSSGCRTVVHPNLGNFVNPPIRIAEHILTRAGFDGVSPAELRRELSLLIAPMASALQTGLLVMLFRRLDYNWTSAIALSALGAVSFSQIVFGSLPDHFILSGACLALGLVLVATSARESRIRWWWWLGLGVVATGITITNLIMVGLLLLCAMMASGRGVLRATGHASAFGLTVLLLTMAMSAALGGVYEDRAPVSPAVFSDASRKHELASWVNKYFRSEQDMAEESFPLVVGFSFAAPVPTVVENPLGIKTDARYHVGFSFHNIENPVSLLIGAGIALVIGMGAVLGCLRGLAARAVVAGAGAVLGFSWLLHHFWGQEYFLYSQHWNAASVALLGGMISRSITARMTVVMAIVLTLIVANNFLVIDEMFRLLG